MRPVISENKRKNTNKFQRTQKINYAQKYIYLKENTITKWHERDSVTIRQNSRRGKVQNEFPIFNADFS